MYPFRQHCDKVCSSLPSEAVIYVSGETIRTRPGTDVDLPFRQHSNFYYLTGIDNAADCHLIIGAQNSNGQLKRTLILPQLSADELVWMDSAVPKDAKASDYGVDEIHKSTSPALKAVEVLKNALTVGMTLYVSSTDEGHDVLIKCIDKVIKSLDDALASARMYKDAVEIEMMQIANDCSSKAHVALMKACAALKGRASSEHELQSLWYGESMKVCQGQAYLPIIAYGRNAATLHYGRNNCEIPAGASSFLLVDAGGEFKCYAADITRTYPVTGKFTQDQRDIYQTVLNAQLAVLAEIKAGVEWETLHRLATRVICDGLVQMSVLKLNNGHETVTIDELCWKKFAPQLFFPHGLGHLIGLDVHDVGGYPDGVERIKEPSIKYLRLRRKLEAGFVVTVEPGLYFVESLLFPEQLTEAHQFVDFGVVQRLMPLGGVRIEDAVLVEEHGHRNLTTAPKSIVDIEAVMAETL